MLIPLKIKRNLSDYDGKFIKIKGKEYYCKTAMDPGDQLFANAVAESLGIICAKDFVVKAKDSYYYLSYSFNNLGNFQDARKLGLHTAGLYDIWIFFEKKYPLHCQKLMFQLVKVYLFDIFLLNSDRNLGNFGILEHDYDYDLVILDNEFIFSDFGVNLYPKLDRDDELNCYSSKKTITRNLSLGMIFNLKSLEYFIATSSKEFYSLLEEFYQILTPEYIMYELDKLNEKGYVLEEQEKFVKLYEIYYSLIGDLLLERGIISGQKLS